MIHYAEYDHQGRYIARGTVLDTDDASVNGDGSLYFGEVDPVNQYHDIENNVPVDKPPRPSVNHTFDFDSKQWTDMRTLSQVQDAKWTEIKLARDTAEFSVFTYKDSQYDCDEVSRSRIQGAVQLASIALTNQLPYSQSWTTASNTAVTLDAIDMVQLGLALGSYTSALHTKARDLRVLIYAATTKSEVESINW